MLALARQLENLKAQPVFLIRKNCSYALSWIGACGFEACLISDDNTGFKVQSANEIEALVQASKILNGNNVLIIDHYGYDKELIKKCKDYYRTVVLIDDYQPERLVPEVDVLVNPNIAAFSIDYQGYRAQKMLLGPNYAMLRPEFTESAGKAIINEKCTNIGICFGASDTANLIEKVIVLLDSIGNTWKVSIAVGSDFAGFDRLERLSQCFSQEITLNRNVGNMAEWLLLQDLIIAAPSTIALEAMALGIPGAFIISEENQIPGARGICEAKLMLYLGRAESFNNDKAAAKLMRLITDKDMRLNYSIRSRQYVDGKGAFRVASEIAFT